MTRAADRSLTVWPSSIAARQKFERDAKRRWPTLRGQSIANGFRYTLMVPVPGYDDVVRSVRIMFDRDHPKVFADGPKASPHRYSDESLCMWYPHDPPDKRWCFEDGLPDLITCIALHLFREQWWRETGGDDGGEWCGEQAPHPVVAR